MDYWLEIDVLSLILDCSCLNIRQPPDMLNEAKYSHKRGLFQILQKSHLPAKVAVLMNTAALQIVGIFVNYMSYRVSSDKTPEAY